MTGTEDWQDPILDVSVPYKSLMSSAISSFQLDEDLQDLVSFFSTLSDEGLYKYMNSTSFQSSLRLLKNILLSQPVNTVSRFKVSSIASHQMSLKSCKILWTYKLSQKLTRNFI